MTNLPSQYENLPEQVEAILRLLNKESALKNQYDITKINTSLKKAIDPRFEIVFAGTFSAGKSMLINALLGQELLFSDIGHATGTECYIEYAESPELERVVLTFLSFSEIQKDVSDLCQELRVRAIDINQNTSLELLWQSCERIIKEEGGPKSTERAKTAYGLRQLLKGMDDNRKFIHPNDNAIYRMEQLGLSFKDATNYARRGTNSSVLKRINYYCHHPLLQDGNVLVDLPGIDAPVKRDAELTYRKVEDPEASAVVCVRKADLEGETRQEEDKLTQTMRDNFGIRDRVFYVFNRMDKVWRDVKLKQKLEDLIESDFSELPRGVYLTSGLLGFFASQIKHTTERDRWGLDTILAPSIKNVAIPEETPPFVLAFNDYCFSGKLSPSKFRIYRDNAESENDTYLRILSLYQTEIIDQLIADSGVEDFREAISRYLKESKRKELFTNLADDLQKVCVALHDYYQENYHYLDSQPANVEAMQERELEQLNQKLQDIALSFKQHIETEINEVVIDNCPGFKTDFDKLRDKMESSLKDSLENFSMLEAYRQTTRHHQRNSIAPLVSILGESFYYLANELEDVLVKESRQLINSFFQRLPEKIRKSEYYHQLSELLPDDGGIIAGIKEVEKRVRDGIEDLARAECGHYVLESPALYSDRDVWLSQFRETLQKAALSLDVTRMKEAEPAIRKLLEIDFKPKVGKTTQQSFRPKIVKTLQSHLLLMGEQKFALIPTLADRARDHFKNTLGKKAEEKLDKNRQAKAKIEEKMRLYNQAVMGINQCLEKMGVSDKLPVIDLPDILIVTETTEAKIEETINPIKEESLPETTAKKKSSRTADFRHLNPKK
ncbi:MAG: hypothetical protein RLZZ338_2290 [Cyanobacteriota bacterium]|jgi:replication fork clamp-binding protein CrfC